MNTLRNVTTTVFVTVLIALVGSVIAVERAEAQIPGLPAEPLKEFGQLIYPVYEGWYDNPDGSYTFLVGYFNMNTKQQLDIPVGENNHVSPGPADQGQPTHFNPGHGWGVFTVRVGEEYADFANKQMTWTLTANGQTMSVPFHTDPNWYVEPFLDAANKNQPPDLRFEENGEIFGGPPVGIVKDLVASVGVPLELNMWTSDVTKKSTTSRESSRRRPPLVITWEKFRGPGDVTFDEAVQSFESAVQNPKTKVTFSEPGEYLLRVEALDETGKGGTGSQCCWTSAHVKVMVSGGQVSTGQ